MNVDGANVAIAAIGLAGTICAGFFALVGKQIKATEKLSNSMDKMAESNGKIAEKMGEVAKETKQGNVEAKERNGHLAELAIENTKHLMSAVQNIGQQKVGEQNVAHQTINQVKE